MSRDTVTIKLEGKVPLDDFAEAILHFSGLINELSEEIAGKLKIDWEIVELRYGSAIASVRGYYADITYVEQVVAATGIVGKALEQKKPIPYSKSIAREAAALTNILDGKVFGISLLADDYQVNIVEPLRIPQITKGHYLGSITGQVETLSIHKGLRFSLYDSLFQRAVTCYFSIEQEERLRDIWGKKAIVTGDIFRDPDSGRPTEIRNIIQVTTVQASAPGSYKSLKGIIPWHEGDLPSEILIERMRNGQ